MLASLMAAPQSLWNGITYLCGMQESKPLTAKDVSLETSRLALAKNKADIRAFPNMKGPMKKAAEKRIAYRLRKIKGEEGEARYKRRLTTLFSLMQLSSTAIATRAKIQRETALMELYRSPKLMGDDTGSCKFGFLPKWQTFGPEGPVSDDIRQGAMGDCYFLASLASVANKTQAFVQDMIRDHGDGTYSVRFFKPGGQGEAVWIGVDARVPMTDGGAVRYAKPTHMGLEQPVVWVPLMEKAFAKFHDKFPFLEHTKDLKGYEGIGNGGFMGPALEVITGTPYADTGMNQLSYRDLVKLGESANEGAYVAAGTRGDCRGKGLFGMHAYTVLGLRETDDGHMIRVRNPWGVTDPRSLPKGDGTFELPLNEFRKNFFVVSHKA